MVESPLIVHKFGGSCLRDSSDLKKIAMALDTDPIEQNIVVVSALWGTTDRLIRAAHEPRYAGRLVNDLDLQHQRFSPSITTSIFSEKYQQVLIGMEKSLSNLSVDEHDSTAYNNLLAAGERLSALVVANELLELGYPAHPVGSEDIGICLKGSEANIEVDIEITKNALSEEALADLPVVTGWFGRGLDGELALLSRGGSDHTAAALAVILDAERVILWKDVDGLLPLNPRWGIETNPISYIGYGEALEFSQKDAPILHSGAIEPLIDRGIPLEIRNISTYHHTHFSTIIGPDVYRSSGFKGITCVPQVSLFQLHYTSGQQSKIVEFINFIQNNGIITHCLNFHPNELNFVTNSIHTDFIQQRIALASIEVKIQRFEGLLSVIGNSNKDEKSNLISTIQTENVQHHLTGKHCVDFLICNLDLSNLLQRLQSEFLHIKSS